MKISVVLVDDWELRGDGSGDMERIQFAPLSSMLQIYESYGLRASINAEVMQQIHHIRYGEKFQNLAALAERWEQVVTDAYTRGHDVQLHVHSQWEGARYEGGKWVLPGNWSILASTRNIMARMIRESRTYLEGLLRKVSADYRCVSFRSGAWAIAPNQDILSVLVEEGIVFDMSIVPGIRFNNSVISLDYTQCEETFLPYYPRMTDARLISDKKEPLICVPTVSFVPSRYSLVKQDLRRVLGRLQKALQPSIPKARGLSSAPSGDDYQVWSRGVRHRIMKLCVPKVTIADLSALTFDMMKEMISVIRRKSAASGRAAVPVILENHTKDITDFSDIERFAHYISRQDDIEVITLKEVALRLQEGSYAVLKKGLS